MTRGWSGIAAALALVAAAGSVAAGDGSVARGFTRDGKPFEPEILSLNGTPDFPAPGDLIWVARISLTLGPEKAGDFTAPADRPGLVLFAPSGERPRPVGARVAWDYAGGKRTLVNGLAALSKEEVRGLRGVAVEAWSDAIAASLADIDPERTCVAVRVTVDGLPRETPLPKLPADLRHLVVAETMSDAFKDHAQLRELKALRSLRVVPCGSRAPFDAGVLAGAKDLRVLVLAGERIANPERLAELTALRDLDLRYAHGLKSVGFVKAMTALRRLELGSSDVEDLSPIAAHPALTVVRASGAPVRQLPEAGAPALRRLDVLSTRLGDEEVAEFARLSPRCDVRHRWTAALRGAVPRCDRVRVRSGGTCCRKPADERTLVDERDPAEIAKLLGGIAVDESRDGGACMCCGEPTIELYRGDALVATVGFHHGQALRWLDGWPADGLLVEVSAELLVRWLDARGVKRPLAEFEAGRAARAAAERRRKQYEQVMPEKVRAAFRVARSPDQIEAAFVENVEGGVERATLYLSLFGCHDGSWGHPDDLAHLLRDGLLPSVKRLPLAAALGAAAADPTLARGAARWVLGGWNWKEVNPASLAAALPVLARAGLSHPRRENRRSTLRALGELGTKEALEALRGVLRGEPAPRPLAAEDRVEPPGASTSFRLGDEPADSPLADATIAARTLAKLGDRGALPAIRALVEKAGPEDRAVLEKAVEALGGGAGGAANEAGAIGVLRMLPTAQALYREGNKGHQKDLQYAESLEELARVGLVDRELGGGLKKGYRFRVEGDHFTWTCQAAPEEFGRTGDRWFFVDESAVIRFSAIGPPDRESWAIGEPAPPGTAEAPRYLGEAAGAWARALSAADDTQRANNAFNRLTKGGAAAVPLAAALLKHADAQVRQIAALALDGAGEAARPALPALTAALSDRSRNARYFAASAIGHLGPGAASAAPALAAALETRESTSPNLLGPKRYYADVRAAAAAALGRIGPGARAAAPALRALSSDENEAVRGAAAQALKAIEAK